MLVAIGVLIISMSEQSAHFCSGAIFMATSYEMSLNRLSLHSKFFFMHIDSLCSFPRYSCERIQPWKVQ